MNPPRDIRHTNNRKAAGLLITYITLAFHALRQRGPSPQKKSKALETQALIARSHGVQE